MNDNIQTDCRLSKMMVNFLDNLADPISIQVDLKVIYANMATVKLCNLRTLDDIIGKSYEEIDSPLCDNEEVIQHWREQDQEIIANPLKQLSMLEIHPNGAESPYTIKKTPFYNENNECIGIIGHMRYLELFRQNDFIRGKLPGSLLLNRPDDFFTERECEIIFLKLQGMTSKVIASTLYRSPRTVENTLQHLYEKAGVSHATDFAGFCEKRNYHRYLPKKFLGPKRFSFESIYTEG